jgi:hypothetical protein
LDILKVDVSLEEATGFDASGAGGKDVLKDNQGNNEDGESLGCKSVPGWKSQTDDTSVGQDMALLDIEEADTQSRSAPSWQEELPETSYIGELDGLGDEEKEAALSGIFPILKPFDISWTLKKHKGNTNLAIDDLMTQSFLEENGSRHKGIDAFYGNDKVAKPKKGKKNSRRQAATGFPGNVDSNLAQRSKWDTAKHDIEFISCKTDMPEKQITTMYHKSGGSLPATILAIIEAHKLMDVEWDDDPVEDIYLHGIQQEFPGISMAHLKALFQVTDSSIADTRALTKALTASPSHSKTPIQLEFRHAPIDLSSTDTPPRTPSKPDSIYPNSLDSAASHIAARNANFEKAAAYYRKGKSDHLMGGVAAYYALEGRTHDVLAKASSSVAADALVASQSSRAELDLHGVNVKDAVRISRERVTNWWHQLGEARVMGGIGGGYRIITGIGKHSEGGRLKLGPAVGKMLIREGWKVEVGSGVLVVRGIAKKR